MDEGSRHEHNANKEVQVQPAVACEWECMVYVNQNRA
jgi:hypothetical protein